MTFIDTLKKYGNDSLSYPTAKVLKVLYKKNPNLDADFEALVFGKQQSVRAPLFHEEQRKGVYQSVPEEYVPYLQAMFANRYSKTISVKEARTKLEGLGYNITSEGQMYNIWNRAETKLNLREMKRSSQLQKERKKAELKELGISKRQPLTEKRLKQLADARKVNQEKKYLAKLKEEEKKAKQRLAKVGARSGKTAKELLETKEEKEAKKGLMRTVSKEALEEAKETLQAQNKKVLYEPTAKQAEFHAADEDIVLYGGAAGGGKSYSMLVDALRYCQEPDYRGLIIRRTSPMLKELIGVSRSMYPKAFPGAKYNKSENVWYFPSGATIQFGYLDKPDDLENYQGLPYSYIGFDEIQHQRSDEGFIYLLSRLRSANPNIKCYIRASANPGGAPWVKERFIDPAEPNTTFWRDGLSYRFIPAALSDNPYLDTAAEGETMSPYRKMLMALPEVKRKQLLEGDWHVGEDSMFAFNPIVHVTKELPPLHWNVINSLDYGYTDPAAALWGAVCPHTGKIVIYSELECLKYTHEAWGRAVKEHEGYLPQGVERVIDHSVFNNTGHTGPGVREKLARMGILPKPADRNREAGWNQIHQRLIVNEETGEPDILIHESCELLIDQLLSAKINEKKPDDIDDRRIKTKNRTHHWDLLDTLRYLLMARPQRSTMQERAMNHKTAAQGFAKYHGYFS